MALGLYTGQARQDVIRWENNTSAVNMILNRTAKSNIQLGPQEDRNKTGLELAFPVHPELRQIIDATPSGT